MNYIWEFMLLADKEGIAREDLIFTNASIPSPYLEVALEDLNADQIEESRIEVNPLYRFSKALGRLIDLNQKEFRQTKELFLDIFFHYVAQLDLREGLDRQTYQIRFLHRDIVRGSFLERASQDYGLFSHREKKAVCLHLLRLMKTGDYLTSFRGAVKAIYPKAIIYANNDTAYELLVYLGVKETETERKRIQLLIDLYLPVQEECYLFYDHHFGIIGIDETMVIDEMMIF